MNSMAYGINITPGIACLLLLPWSSRKAQGGNRAVEAHLIPLKD